MSKEPIIEQKQEQEQKLPLRSHTSVVFLGHQASGKSTLAGHLLHQCHRVSDQEIEKLEEEAGNASRKYAWAMDTHEEERVERGGTINVKLRKLDDDITILDAPGHRAFAKNTSSAVSQADVAILVVPACVGEFEANFAQDGQLRQHAVLAFAMGIKHVIVAVNKMDDKSVEYATHERFRTVQNEVYQFLLKVGFRDQNVFFAPVSGWRGDNLTQRSDAASMQWYTGPTLMDLLDTVARMPFKRLADRPLRVPIQDVHYIDGIGTVLTGRIATGTMKVGMVIAVSGMKGKAAVGSIEMHGEAKESAGPGDNIGFSVENAAWRLVKCGMVVGEAENEPPCVAQRFEAHIVVTDRPNLVLPGYTPIVDCHTAHVACRFDKLLRIVDKRTGATIEERPKSLKAGQAAVCELVPCKPMCVEAFNAFTALGRFVVRDGRKIVGVGKVLRVLPLVPAEADAAIAAAAAAPLD